MTSAKIQEDSVLGYNADGEEQLLHPSALWQVLICAEEESDRAMILNELLSGDLYKGHLDDTLTLDIQNADTQLQEIIDDIEERYEIMAEGIENKAVQITPLPYDTDDNYYDFLLAHGKKCRLLIIQNASASEADFYEKHRNQLIEICSKCGRVEVRVIIADDNVPGFIRAFMSTSIARLI